MQRVSTPALLSSLLGATLAVSGCSGEAASSLPGRSEGASSPSSSPSSTAVPSGDAVREVTDADFIAIRRLLDVRAKAVVDGDRAAFLATVDRDSELRSGQATYFENLQDLEVGRLYYGMVDVGLVPDEVEGGDAVLRPELYEHVQLRGINERPVSNQVSITFVERDGRWLVGREEVDATFESQSRPWFGTRVDVATAPDLLVLTDADADVDAETLLDSTQTALAAVEDVLGLPADDPLLVDATTNGLASTMTPSTQEQAAAVAFGTYATDRTGTTFRGRAGSVVKANPDEVSYLVEEGFVLRHELTHFVLDTDYYDEIPQWASEGIADYVGNQPFTMPDDFTIPDETLDVIAEREVRLIPPGRWGDDPAADYLSANAFAQYLVQTYGMDDYLQMMRAYVDIGRENFSRYGANTYGEGYDDDVMTQVYGNTPSDVARGGFKLLRALD